MAGNYTRRINLYINGQQVRGDINSINSRMKHLQNTVRNMTIGSREYIRTMSQIRHLKGMIDQHNASLRVTQINLTSLKGLANAFNKYWPLVMGSIGAFAGVVFSAKRAAEDFASVDDLFADVMKVTGLTRDQVVELNEELKRMDTRSAQETLLELAWVAGKLGISAQEDILGFVNAADKITVALAKDLGGSAEEAVRQIGKMVEVFEIKDMYGIEEAMLRTGSAINELGMASTAQESFLIAFSARVSGIAPAANVSLQSVLGLGATLDMLGQKSEVSATAYSRIMTTLARDTEVMARLTGMSIKDFTELFERDANEAMLVLLESVGSSEGGFAALIDSLGEAGLEGQRLTQVLGVLSRNTHIIRQQQELANEAFERGDSIMKEFIIKNNNAQAAVEKKKKEIANLRKELGERLFPVYMSGLNLQAQWTSTIGKTIQFIYENRRAVISLVSGLLAYTVVLRTLNGLKMVNIAVGQHTSFVLLQIAMRYSRLTGNLTRAAAAQRMLNALQLKNPWNAIAAAVVGVSIALYLYIKRARDAANATEKFWKDMELKQAEAVQQHTIRLNDLFEQLKMTNPETERRRDVLKQIQELYPDFLENLDAEKATIQELEIAYRDYLVEIEKTIKKRVLISEWEGKLSELSRVEREMQKEREGGRKWNNLLRERSSILIDIGRIQEELKDQRMVDAFGEQVLKWTKELEELQKAYDYLTAPNKKFPDLPHMLGDELISPHNEFRIQQIKERIEELIRLIDDAKLKADQAEQDAQRKTITPPGVIDYSERAQELEEIALMEQYHRGELLRGHLEYTQKMREIDIRYTRGRLSQADKDGEDYLKLRRHLATKLIEAHREEEARLAAMDKETVQSDPVEKERQAHINRLKELDLFHDTRRERTKEEVDAIAALEDQLRQKLNEIDAKLIKDEIEKREKSYEQQLQELQIFHMEQLRAITTLEEAKSVLAETLSSSELAKIRTINQAKIILQQEHQKIESELALQHVNNLIFLVKSIMETAKIEDSTINLSDAILSDEEFQILIQKLLDLKQKLEEVMGEIEGDAEGLTKNKLRGMHFDIFGFTQEDWEKMFENLKNAKGGVKELIAEMQMAAIALGNAWIDINTLISNKEQKRLQEYEQRNKAYHQILDNRLKAGFISEEYYNHHKERLENELEKKKAQFAYDRAKRERNVALMTAIVNTAAGAAKALPNLILAGIVAAAGALQIAIITSTPLPEIPGMEEGGFLDVRRAQDNKKYRAKYNPKKRGFINEPTIIAGEEATEYVVPGEALKNPAIRSIVNMIENARVKGNMASLNPFIENITPLRDGAQYNGAVTPATTTPNNSINEKMAEQLAMNNQFILKATSAIEKFNEITEDGIKAYVLLSGKDGFYEQDEKFKKLKQNANF